MIGVLWAYEGWQYVTFSAGEAKDPQRTFPRAISIATFLLIVLYLMANLGYVRALGAGRRSEQPARRGGRHRHDPRPGCRCGGERAHSRVDLQRAQRARAHDAAHVLRNGARRLFFQKLASVHPRFGTPAFSIVALTAWGALLAASGTFNQLLTYAVFTGWIFYALGALAVMMLRRSEPNAARPFRVPGYPVTPILFVVAAAALVINTIATQPGISSIGLGFVALGAPAFFIWRSRGRAVPAAASPDVSDNDSRARGSATAPAHGRRRALGVRRCGERSEARRGRPPELRRLRREGDEGLEGTGDGDRHRAE